MIKGIMVRVGDRYVAMVTRSGSHSLLLHIVRHICPHRLDQPSTPPKNQRWHPYLELPEHIKDGRYYDISDVKGNLAVIVRNPVERFRSACARQNLSVEQGLLAMESDGHFWPLKDMGLIADDIAYFRFPDQINECAEWLGLPTPVPHENGEPEEKKPVLTLEQESAVRLAYAEDITLWESLRP